MRRSEGAAHRWAQSARGSVLGRAGLRCGRTGRRSARVGLARGEMSEDRLDEFGRLDARDDAQRAATHITALDVDMEDSLEPLHPAHRRGTRCMRLAGGLVDRIGDDAEAVLEVRGEHAVVSGEMGAGAWHEGGEAGDEFDGVEHDMRGAVAEGVLESIHDLPAVTRATAHRLPAAPSSLPARPNPLTSTAKSPLPVRQRTRQRPRQYSNNNADRWVILPILLDDIGRAGAAHASREPTATASRQLSRSD